MLTAQHVIDSITEENRIIKHLYSKITDDIMDWRPNEHQRSIRELLQYHLRMGSTIATFLQEGYSPEKAKQMRVDTEAADLSNFPALMDQQLQFVSSYLTNATEDHLNEEVDLFGMGQPLPNRHYISHILFKNYVAYRMQLFLYLKMAGKYELNTMNNWAGMDPQPQS